MDATGRPTALPWNLWIASVLWLSMCLGGFSLTMGYDFRPGRVGPALASWPAEAMLPRRDGRLTVVAFLHPRCVCTRSTVSLLLKTLDSHPDVELIVPVFVPPGGNERASWMNGDYVKTIRSAVPRAAVIADLGGQEALRFGAMTSGTVLVYDGRGREIFRGGITEARGSDRESRSQQRLALVLAGGRSSISDSTPVYGCSLVQPERLQDGE